MTGVAPSLVRQRCHYCSKFRNTSEVMKLGTGGAVMCWRCWEWHYHAIRVLAGEPPRGCQECGTTFANLNDFDGKGNVRMQLVPKDGLYQVLCEPCARDYVRKRADLFGSTEYGYHEVKLR